MTFSRLHIATFLALSILIWTIVLLVQGASLDIALLKPFGIVVGILVLIGAIFEKYLWRIPLIHGWFVQRPDLRGTWLVDLSSDWIDPDTNEPSGKRECYLSVSQSLSSLQMNLMSEESESWFIASEIRKSKNELNYQIVGVYANKPNIQLRGTRSEIHQGALILEAHGPPNHPNELIGEFWTDRKTCGTFRAHSRITTNVTNFNKARDLYKGI